MRELKIDINSVNLSVNGIKMANNAIDTKTSSLPSITKCNGIMISEYKNRMEKIGQLLAKYKTLVDCDAVDILTAKDKLKEMDSSIEDKVMVFKTPF